MACCMEEVGTCGSSGARKFAAAAAATLLGGVAAPRSLRAAHFSPTALDAMDGLAGNIPVHAVQKVRFPRAPSVSGGQLNAATLSSSSTAASAKNAASAASASAAAAARCALLPPRAARAMKSTAFGAHATESMAECTTNTTIVNPLAALRAAQRERVARARAKHARREERNKEAAAAALSSSPCAADALLWCASPTRALSPPLCKRLRRESESPTASCDDDEESTSHTESCSSVEDVVFMWQPQPTSAKRHRVTLHDDGATPMDCL